MSDIIHTDPERDLQVLFDTELPPDLLELLQTTVWGQRGMLFRSLDMAEMLKGLARPSFLRLVKGGRTVAGAVRNHKTIEMAGTRYDATHLVFLAVHRDFIQQGLGKVLARVSRRHYLEALRPPGLLYGYVESGNKASLRLNLGVGYRDLGEVRSRVFSRARPRASGRVEALGRDGLPDMLARLKATYRTHALCGFDGSLDPDRCFVVRRQGEIVAGAQMRILHWKLMRLPGRQGRLTLSLLPHIPFLGRDFTPADLRFAHVGNLYAREGSEKLISEILETVLADRRLPFATTFIDPRGEPERRILAHTDLGLLNRVLSAAFHVIADFKGVSPRDIRAICTAPVFISPEDPL